MSHQFTIQFTEGHIKYACRKFFVRYVGIGFPIAWSLMVVVFAQRVASHKADILAGVCVTVAVMSALFFLSIYVKRLAYSLTQFRKFGNKVSYELSEDFFRARSEMGSSELKWETFQGIWIFPKVWLLMYDKAGYLTLPVDQISQEVKKFLKRKMVSVGGKIT